MHPYLYIPLRGLSDIDLGFVRLYVAQFAIYKNYNSMEVYI